jgi:Family of unknown function (DUF6807)
MSRTHHLSVSSICGAAFVAAALAYPAAAADGKVRLEKKGDTVVVSLDGSELAVYQTGPKYQKPFFSPVRSEGGTIVTRSLEKPIDHPHHKGIWVAVDEVNDIKFWAEKGKIANAKVEIVAAEGNPAKMRVTNHWLGNDGQPIVVETTDIAIFSNRLFAYDIHLTAAADSVEFGDTKEGLFGIRLPVSATEKSGSGRIVNADGKKGSKECWGQSSAWVDYYGTIEGQTHGAAIFDHPQNPRPSRYHVRDYGLFTISPFGEKAYTNGESAAKPVILKKGETYRLRYGIYIHPGDTTSAKVADVYKQWLKQ